MVVFGVDPAGAGQAAPQQRQGLADTGGDFEGGEEPGHGGTSTEYSARHARRAAMSRSNINVRIRGHDATVSWQSAHGVFPKTPWPPWLWRPGAGPRGGSS